MGVVANLNVGQVPRQKKGRVLFICYLFPPVGGAGVQRPVKFIKYLHRLGWEITVLTVANPSVPVFDQSLMADVPSDTVVCRAPTLEPDYRYKAKIAGKNGIAGTTDLPEEGGFHSLMQMMKKVIRSLGGMLLQPDPQVLWLPGASREALRLLREKPHDLIFATAPPYSSLLLGSWLKNKTGLPLILDYRDEWDLSSAYRENSRRDQISLLVQNRMQRNILRNADGFVATTKASVRQIAERAREFRAQLSGICIYNGFDASDFEKIDETRKVRKENDRVRIVYTGTLWNLTSVEPLVKALEHLSLISPLLMNKLELIFAGRKMSHQIRLLDRLASTGCRVDVKDYCDHETAISLMSSADVLCLLLSDVEGAERVAPAKLFEYLAMRKEILAIAPYGETAAIVKRYFPGNHFTGGDIAGIAGWIENRIRAADKKGGMMGAQRSDDISEFSREHQARQLSDYFSRFVHQEAGLAGTGKSSRKEKAGGTVRAKKQRYLCR